MSANDPLAGPFPTGHQLCDASNDEGYAKDPSPEAAAPSRATLLRQAAIGQ
jgi:hypothetical protein